MHGIEQFTNREVPEVGGTIVGVLSGGGALTDVEKELNDMVEGLIPPDGETITWWRKEWSAAAQKRTSPA